jgi:RNA polymerase sigma-70 factor (ECF subfamily)
VELLDAWRGGDVRAGDVLFRRYFAQLSRFFRNKADVGVEDLIQSTFLASIAGRDELSRGLELPHLPVRHRASQPVRPLPAPGREIDFVQTSVVDLGASPSGPLTRHEEAAALLRALRAIPLEFQIVLELTYWEGMKGPEIAEVLGIPANTVRSRLARARDALRQALTDGAREPGLLRATLADLDGWAETLRVELGTGDA